MAGHEHDRHDRDHETHRRAAQPDETALQLFNEVLHPGDRRPLERAGGVQGVRMRIRERRYNGDSDEQPPQSADGDYDMRCPFSSTGACPPECERHHWPHLLWLLIAKPHGENSPPCVCSCTATGGALAGAAGEAGRGEGVVCTLAPLPLTPARSGRTARDARGRASSWRGRASARAGWRGDRPADGFRAGGSTGTRITAA